MNEGIRKGPLFAPEKSDEMNGRFDKIENHELFGYMGHFRGEEHIRRGYKCVGEIPLPVDVSELPYLQKSDNDLQEDYDYPEVNTKNDWDADDSIGKRVTSNSQKSRP